MTLSPFLRRFLAWSAASLISGWIYALWPQSTVEVGTVTSTLSVEQMETRLVRLRQLAASAPAKEAILKSVTSELAAREKGLLTADTAPQAQAQLIQILRGIVNAESVPVEIRSTEIGTIAAFGDAYGAVNIAVQMDCRVEQLINILAAIGSRAELLTTSDMRVTSSSPKEKTMGVRLTVTALVPRKLVPAKKAL